MRIPESVLQTIRSRVSILDVVGRHVALKRTGKNWKGLCPFHAEKTPSFVVNDERGTYHCFGCGVGGSVFQFVMEAEGQTFPEAVRILAESCGVPVEEGLEEPRRHQAREEKRLLYDVLALAARYYRHQLTEGRAGERARGYLDQREVPAPAADTFGLGCAPVGWDHLCRYLRRKGVDLGLAAQAGLVVERASGGHYDRLRDRLVFPIHDASGRVVSFGGRILGAGEPKYLNGPDSPVFRKGELLYGVHEGAESLRHERRALIVEGYLDVISLHARGFPSALATLGTALTPDHLQILRRRVDEVVLVYDGDEAGRKAAFRSLDLFLAEGFPCRGVLLPPEHDPDSFVREGGDLAALVAGAEPLLQVYIADVLDRFDTANVDGKLAAVDELAPKLAAVPDPLARDLYCRDVAETLRLDETRMRERLRAAKHPRRRSDAAGKEGAPRATDPVEKAMLECLVYEPEHRGAFLSDGIDGWMNPGVLQEAARFVARRTEGPDHLPLEDAPALARARLAAVLVQDERPHTAYSVLESTLRLRSLKARQSQIERDLRLAEARGDQHQVSELLREQGDIGEALMACQGALRKKSP